MPTTTDSTKAGPAGGVRELYPEGPVRLRKGRSRPPEALVFIEGQHDSDRAASPGEPNCGASFDFMKESPQLALRLRN
jgi:hypothetical protein